MEKFDEIVLKDKERRLSISRVPKQTKELFTQIAEESFAGDYGLFLKKILEDAIEYQNMKAVFLENIDLKLNSILEIVSNKQEPEKKEEFITLLSGRKIKKK